MHTGYASVASSYVVRPRPGLGREVSCGVLAGQVAGMAMAVSAMALFSAFLSRSPFYPLQVIARSLLDDASLDGFDARSVLIGALVHQLGPSLFWGAMFGVLVWAIRPRRGAGLLALGLLIGAIAQVVDVHLVLPALASSAGRAASPLHVNDAWLVHVPFVVSSVAHLVFGAALSLYPWSYDPLARTFD